MFTCPSCRENLFDEARLLSMQRGMRGRAIWEAVHSLAIWRQEVKQRVIFGMGFSNPLIKDEARVAFGWGLLSVMAIQRPARVQSVTQLRSTPDGLTSIYCRLDDLAPNPGSPTGARARGQSRDGKVDEPHRPERFDVISPGGLRTLRRVEDRLSHAALVPSAAASGQSHDAWTSGFRQRALDHRRGLLALFRDPPRMAWSNELPTSDPQRLMELLKSRATGVSGLECGADAFVAWCCERLHVHWLVDSTVEITRRISYPAPASADPWMLEWPTVDLAVNGPRTQYAAAMIDGPERAYRIGVFQSLVSTRGRCLRTRPEDASGEGSARRPFAGSQLAWRPSLTERARQLTGRRRGRGR